MRAPPSTRATARGVLLAAGAAILPPAAAAPAADPRSWDFVVTFADAKSGIVEVEWTIRGYTGPVRICADRDGTARHVHDLRQLEVAPAPAPAAAPLASRKLAADPDDEDCFAPAVPRGATPLRLCYRYDLAALARQSGDPDDASRNGDDWLFNDGALLLRPDPLPAGAAITVEFRLPAGLSVAAPWDRVPGPAHRYRYDAAQYDAGSYVAVGKLVSLGEVKVRGGTLRLTALDRPHRASDAALRAWVERAASTIADFYGGLPGGRVHVVLVPIQGNSDPGIFGTVRRRGLPSVVMLFGAECRDTGFAGDWMGVHELFHLGNPPLEERLPWVTEGLATYYQDVLLARAGAQSSVKMWGDLHDSFRRFCSGRRSIADESKRPGFNLNYMRVYWGSACAFFQLDVAIRRKNANRRSLDDVVRALLKSPHDLTDDEVRAELARETSAKLVSELLDGVGKPPLDEIYRRLGIEPTGKTTVLLHDDAPEAALRRGIF